MCCSCLTLAHLQTCYNFSMSSQKSYEVYLPAIKRRWQAEQRQHETRRLQAYEVARELATVLYTKFAATDVILFGSVTNPTVFDQYSDIDLAVTGIGHARFYLAVADMLAEKTFKVDLVDLDQVPPTIRDAILRDGERL